MAVTMSVHDKILDKIFQKPVVHFMCWLMLCLFKRQRYEGLNNRKVLRLSFKKNFGEDKDLKFFGGLDKICQKNGADFNFWFFDDLKWSHWGLWIFLCS